MVPGVLVAGTAGAGIVQLAARPAIEWSAETPTGKPSKWLALIRSGLTRLWQGRFLGRRGGALRSQPLDGEPGACGGGRSGHRGHRREGAPEKAASVLFDEILPSEPLLLVHLHHPSRFRRRRETRQGLRYAILRSSSPSERRSGCRVASSHQRTSIRRMLLAL